MVPHRIALTALFLPCLAATAAVSTGCQPEEAGVEELVDDVIGEFNDRLQIACDCFDEYGYEKRSDCLEENGEILPSMRRCVQDAYARNEEAARSYLECRLPLMQELTECVDRKLECNDYESDEVCYDDFQIGARDCIELPNSVERGLEDCG